MAVVSPVPLAMVLQERPAYGAFVQLLTIFKFDASDVSTASDLAIVLDYGD